MRDPLLFWLIITSTALVVGGYRLARHLHRRRALALPFPEDWLRLLESGLPIYQRLPEALQKELQRHIQKFLYDKSFIGCAGLEVTDRMRVTVAACACLMLLNRRSLEYKAVRWIYLYPSEFVVHHDVQDAAGVVSKARRRLLGEAWHNGRVILSWDDVRRGAYDFNDGHNVALHEFAHQLDNESGGTNGAPLLYSRGAYGSWAVVMSREFESLRQHAYFGTPTVLDSYGATSPAEFFAVATESFFEQPHRLADEHPALFAELQKYFHTDPRDWHPAPSDAG